MKCSRRCFVTLALGSAAHAQTLAHPGWRGNGIASEAWWKHTAFVRFSDDTTFAKALDGIDAMSQAGADSLILPRLLQHGPSQPNGTGTVLPFDEKFGTADQLDALLREASARRLHVLLRADLLRLAADPGELRFWMSRGIAGFDVGDVSPAQMDTLSLLRGAINRFPGQRVLLAHVPASAGSRTALGPVSLRLLSPGEARAGKASPDVVEVNSADALRTVPPGATLVVDSRLLTEDGVPEALRRAIRTRGATAQALPGPSNQTRIALTR